MHLALLCMQRTDTDELFLRLSCVFAFLSCMCVSDFSSGLELHSARESTRYPAQGVLGTRHVVSVASSELPELWGKEKDLLSRVCAYLPIRSETGNHTDRLIKGSVSSGPCKPKIKETATISRRPKAFQYSAGLII